MKQLPLNRIELSDDVVCSVSKLCDDTGHEFESLCNAIIKEYLHRNDFLLVDNVDCDLSLKSWPDGFADSELNVLIHSMLRKIGDEHVPGDLVPSIDAMYRCGLDHRSHPDYKPLSRAEVKRRIIAKRSDWSM